MQSTYHTVSDTHIPVSRIGWGGEGEGEEECVGGDGVGVGVWGWDYCLRDATAFHVKKNQRQKQ